MKISLRPANDADRAFALATHHAAYHDVVVRQFGTWDTIQQNAFFEAGWSATTHSIILADGMPCGYCSIEAHPHDIHVRELVIAPAYQNRGIGSTVLRRLQSKAQGHGTGVRLGTFHENRAVALYRRLGFREVDRTDTHILMEWRVPRAEAPHADDAERPPPR